MLYAAGAAFHPRRLRRVQQVTQGVYLIDGQEVPHLKQKEGIRGAAGSTMFNR